MKKINKKADEIFAESVVKLYKMGYSSREIARSFKRSHTTIAEIIKRYLQTLTK